VKWLWLAVKGTDHSCERFIAKQSTIETLFKGTELHVRSVFFFLSLCFLFHETNSNYNFHTQTWWMRRRIYFIRKAKWGRQNWEEVSVNKYIIVTWWKEKKAEKSWIMWKYSTFTVWSNFCHFNMICDWSYSRGIETILSFNEYVSL
jgi:hypothetical protein